VRVTNVVVLASGTPRAAEIGDAVALSSGVTVAVAPTRRTHALLQTRPLLRRRALRLVGADREQTAARGDHEAVRAVS